VDRREIIGERGEAIFRVLITRRHPTREPNEQGYIISANGESRSGISSICTSYPLNPEVLALLWDEVVGYWSAASTLDFRSILCDPKWSSS
jgi:hypothetical protein